MTELISGKFQSLEAAKAEVLDYLSKKSAEELALAPAGKWSMIQAMRHIQMSEEGSLQYLMKKSLAGDGMKARGVLPRINLSLLSVVYKLGMKFKAPAPIANPANSSLDELKEDWGQTRKKMKEFLEDYPDKWIYKAVYRHPFLGLLNVTDALVFFEAHLAHHTRQVYRIEKEIRKTNADGSR